MTTYAPARAPFLWLVEREILRYLRIWRFSMAGPVLSTLLFVLVFGKILARDIGGADYGQFIVPGLVAQAVVNVGFYNGTTSLFEARRDRYINDVFASPVRWWEINAAMVVASMVRGVIVSAAILAVAVPITGVSIERPFYLLAVGTGVLVVAAQVGIIAGALANKIDHVYSIESLVILPLGFLGGIFYSVNTLAEPWGFVSHFNPVFWLVQGTRFGFLGTADVNPAAALIAVWIAVLVLSGCSASLFATSRRLKP